MFQSAPRLLTLPSVVLVGFLISLCNAADADGYGYDAYQQQHMKRNISTLKCFDCNSEYDPRCGDPFDSFSIGIINCTDRKPPEPLLERDPYIQPKVCRKLVQKIEGRIRIVRGCGYLPDDRDDKECVVRSGTKDVNVKYCSCTHSLCNAALPQQRPTVSAIAAVLSIALAKTCLQILT